MQLPSAKTSDSSCNELHVHCFMLTTKTLVTSVYKWYVHIGRYLREECHITDILSIRALLRLDCILNPLISCISRHHDMSSIYPLCPLNCLSRFLYLPAARFFWVLWEEFYLPDEDGWKGERQLTWDAGMTLNWWSILGTGNVAIRVWSAHLSHVSHYAVIFCLSSTYSRISLKHLSHVSHYAVIFRLSSTYSRISLKRTPRDPWILFVSAGVCINQNDEYNYVTRPHITNLIHVTCSGTFFGAWT